ncbi:DUF6213 family protein [Kitasatospora sp. NPDC054768]
MRRVYVKVRCDEDGSMVVPAADVSAMLRDLASGWQERVDRGWSGVDPATVSTLGAGLVRLADRMDVEFIVRTPGG